MKKFFLGFLAIGFLTASFAHAEKRFDAITFDPAVEGGEYFTVHGSKTFDAWQGHFGLYFDYANRPLQFVGQGSLVGQRQSIIDHIVTANPMGAIGLTDWMAVGMNMPIVIYNWYYSDNPTTDPTGDEDFGTDMGDVELLLKFRLLDIEKYKVGVAFIPHITLPTGNPEKYTGNGVVTGGGTLAVDFKPLERLELALNVGAIFREGFTRTYTFSLGGGATATDTIAVDDMVTFGAAANFKVTKQFQVIGEAFGSTSITDFLEKRSTPFEGGGGGRYYFGDSGFAMSAGGTIGFLDGIGKPRFRTFVGLNWYSPTPEPCPVCKTVVKQNRTIIKENRIILWGKIFFDTDKATIKPVSFPVLDDVADVIRVNSDIKLVEVQGHTDWRGSDDYNLKLSQRRAESAVKYLIDKGVDPSKLRAVGYGETQPIAANNTAEGMSQNRRTEFIIAETFSGKTINSGEEVVDEQTSVTIETAQPKPVPAKAPEQTKSVEEETETQEEAPSEEETESEETTSEEAATEEQPAEEQASADETTTTESTTGEVSTGVQEGETETVVIDPKTNKVIQVESDDASSQESEKK